MEPTCPRDWIGRTERREDAMDPWAAAALHAALERPGAPPGPGDALPPFWHWLHFREAAPASALGPDGHPAPGGFMPCVAQPRRMWAGGRLAFHAPLPLGRPAARVSTVVDVAEKTGRRGPLTFVTVRHEISGAQGLAVTEEQDIVYREDPEPGAVPPEPPSAPGNETCGRAWTCDPVLLFRYSALTFNGHRIHYDADYARSVEGYPGLVVHGPLLATLLLELAAGLGPPAAEGPVPLARFAFRATAPVFAGERFETCARPEAGGLALWVRGADGRLAMTAEAAW